MGTFDHFLVSFKSFVSHRTFFQSKRLQKKPKKWYIFKGDTIEFHSINCQIWNLRNSPRITKNKKYMWGLCVCQTVEIVAVTRSKVTALQFPWTWHCNCTYATYVYDIYPVHIWATFIWFSFFFWMAMAPQPDSQKTHH